jgi:fucose permease
MFRVNGKNYALTFTLVSTLFFLWGFCNGMIDVPNEHFQSSLHISKAESGFVSLECALDRTASAQRKIRLLPHALYG